MRPTAFHALPFCYIMVWYVTFKLSDTFGISCYVNSANRANGKKRKKIVDKRRSNYGGQQNWNL